LNEGEKMKIPCKDKKHIWGKREGYGILQRSKCKKCHCWGYVRNKRYLFDEEILIKGLVGRLEKIVSAIEKHEKNRGVRDEKTKVSVNYVAALQEGQNARMTDAEALAETRRRWGKNAVIEIYMGEGWKLVYEVRAFAHWNVPGEHGEGDSWEAAFKAADKEGAK
jgi:hypothetical protein